MNHIQNYMKAYNIGHQDWLPCEVCGGTASQIHHIKFRSRGGKDDPDNLIALCYTDHDRAHFRQKPYLKEDELKKIHETALSPYGGRSLAESER